MSLPQALARNFLGHAPDWYKLTIVGFLVVNPLALLAGGADGPLIAGWLLLLEFIFTLAMALRCYPLQPGGLLAIEGVLLGLTTPASVYDETLMAMPVILLLVFMVAGIYFLRELLLFTFTKILLGINSRLALALAICLTSAVLSAFLDALTVIAVLITIGAGFYQVFHRFASGKHYDAEHDMGHDEGVQELHRSDLDAFRAFLRGLMMHASVGTALGGVMTQVGEPQNLLIAKHADWAFVEFFAKMAPVSVPVLIVGLVTCVVVEKLRWFGYGASLPASVRQVLADYDREQSRRRTSREVAVLIVQAIAAVILVIALGFHFAEVGIIGLLVIVFATAFTGVTEEQRLGKAFEAALPFTALLVVFFAIVGAARPAPVRAGRECGAAAAGAGADRHVLSRQRRALGAQRQRVRRDHLHHRSEGGAARGHDHARAVRRAGDRHQHRHQHSEHRDAERPGRVPVPADLGAGAADQTFVRAHDVDGAALHRDPDADWPLGRCVPDLEAVLSRPQ